MSLELIEEPYLSVQGEGTHIGKPMVFVRTALCNVRCLWCDSTYTFTRGKKWEFKELYDLIKKFGCKNIWFTGGEPLLHAKDIHQFINEYLQGYTTYLCTSGAVWNQHVMSLLERVDYIVLDYKLRSSGAKIPTSPSLIEFMCKNFPKKFELKFVVGDRDDMVLVRFKTTRICELAGEDIPVTLQPIYMADNRPCRPYPVFFEWFIELFHGKENVRFLPQWHKVIFPDRFRRT